MKKKLFEVQRARAAAIFDWWEPVLGLRFWRVERFYHREPSDIFESGEANSGTAAVIWAKWQYIEARIDINTPLLPEFDDDRLEDVIVHELCHALVNELKEPDPDGKHEERVVSHLSAAFRQVRDRARAEALAGQ